MELFLDIQIMYTLVGVLIWDHPNVVRPFLR